MREGRGWEEGGWEEEGGRREEGGRGHVTGHERHLRVWDHLVSVWDHLEDHLDRTDELRMVFWSKLFPNKESWSRALTSESSAERP